MIPEIIAGITITGVFIGFGITNIFSSKLPKYGSAYPDIGITEYHELRWFYDSDDE
jgi:hypothetical protein